MDTALETLLNKLHPGSDEYRPVVFKLPADQSTLRSLLEKEPNIRIHDRIHAQLRELLKSLNPSTRFNGPSLEDAIYKHLGGKSLKEYGCWVYYTWSRTLVHVLDAEEFSAVRTDRNRNKITREEQEVLATKKVGVIGLSVGQSVSVTMALERCFGEIRLADFDTLDLSNLNRIRTGTGNLGLNKAIVTAREIAEIDPYLNVICFTDGLTKENMDAFFTEGGKLDILVEECDSVEIKILARQKAKALRIPVVMDTSDRGCLDVERFDLEPERPILHGWIDHLDLEAASKPMSAEEKVPYMLPITGVETLSPRMKASVLELGSTISTWPQLATSVILGGAVASDVVRRIALNEFHLSGRWYIDLEDLVNNEQTTPTEPSPETSDPELSEAQLEALELHLDIPSARALDLDPNVLKKLVAAGGQAPSPGNVQPWRFLWRDRRLVLLQDRARSRSFWDPDKHMAQIALGACVENVVLKAHELGYEVGVKLHEHTGQSGITAQFEFLPKEEGVHEDHGVDHLASVITTCRADHSIGRAAPIAPDLKDRILRTTDRDGHSISWLDQPQQLQEIAALHGAAERIRLMHPESHRDYFKDQIRWSHEEAMERGDGLDVESFGLPPMAVAALKVMSDPRAMSLVRKWNGGQSLSTLPSLSILGSSALALVTVPQSLEGSYLITGRAIQRLWLEANAGGFAVEPVSSVILLSNAARKSTTRISESEKAEIEQLRTRFQIFHGPDRKPVMLLRIFQSVLDQPRSVRRPVDELLTLTINVVS